MIIKVNAYVGNVKVTNQIGHIFRVASFETQGDKIQASLGVAAGNMLVFNGTTWVVVTPPTVNGQRLTADLTLAGKVKWVTPSDVTPDLENFLLNGGFDIAQRQVPGTLTNVADNAYSADRWRSTRANADLQYQRQDGLGESGLTSRYYGTYKKITNTGKFLACQIIEGINSVALRGKAVSFQIKMKASASKTIRMAVLELQNAGTIDTIPASLVSSWNANSTDPTFGSNLAIITAAESKSVTTAWQQFSVNVTVPSNSKNLIVAIWSDSGFAANDTLSLAEAGLYITATTQAWKPRPVAQELAACQRYYVSFTNDGVAWAVFGMGVCWSTTLSYATVPFLVEMRRVPTFSHNGVSNFRVWTNGVTLTPTTITNPFGHKKQGALQINFAAGGLANAAVMFSTNDTADGQLYFDAEL